jgi:hypothetical protein
MRNAFTNRSGIAVGLRSLGEKMQMIRQQAIGSYRKRVLLSLFAQRLQYPQCHE